MCLYRIKCLLSYFIPFLISIPSWEMFALQYQIQWILNVYLNIMKQLETGNCLFSDICNLFFKVARQPSRSHVNSVRICWTGMHKNGAFWKFCFAEHFEIFFQLDWTRYCFMARRSVNTRYDVHRRRSVKSRDNVHTRHDVHTRHSVISRLDSRS